MNAHEVSFKLLLSVFVWQAVKMPIRYLWNEQDWIGDMQYMVCIM